MTDDVVAHWFEVPKGLKPPSPEQLSWIEKKADSARWMIRKGQWDRFFDLDNHVAENVFKLCLRGVDTLPLNRLWWQLMQSVRSL